MIPCLEFAPVLAEAPAPTTASPADAALVRGIEAFQHGLPADAIAACQQALDLYRGQNETLGQIDAMIDLGLINRSLGEYAEARSILNDAVELSEKFGDRQRLRAALTARGGNWVCTRFPEQGREDLDRAMELARGDGDLVGQAAVLNNRGNLFDTQAAYAQAAKDYSQAADLASRGGSQPIAGDALANAALAAARAGDTAQAREFARRASDSFDSVQDSREKAMALITAGRADEAITGAADRAPDLLSAWHAYTAASDSADKAGDQLSLSYARGSLGHLYEISGQYDDALKRSREAELGAEQIGANDPLFRWQWQIGRILRAQGHADAAIREYEMAAGTLKLVRADIAVGWGNGGGLSFRQSVGPLFFQLADLLLRRSETQEPAEAMASLLAARDSVEQFKSGEMEDYFQDKCVNLLRVKPVETVSPRTAIVYIIALPDRVELLVTAPPLLKRFTAPVTGDALDEVVKQFRFYLVDRNNARYLTPATILYHWLIDPIEPELKAQGVQTLVFAPDGLLRNVPMGALSDGKHFLIERYAVAVTPGLTLMEPKPIQGQSAELLAAGLSDATEGFAALPHVPEELSTLHRLYPGAELLNQQFDKKSVRDALRREHYSIVHIASHGVFSGDASKTFLLTYQGKLSLPELQALIAPSKFRGEPIELLTLSACETAAGDDRAALGLAGVAIKAGARSALATLWRADDQATASVVEDFYTRLKNDPTLSKARALQQAQIRLLSDPRYHHPYYWSPYLLIGNWL